MEHQEGSFQSVDGSSVYYQSWQPEQVPLAVLIVAHGMAEHSGRYRRFAEYFVDQGYAVTALDHPGHGKSDGVPGFIPRFADYTQTLALYVRQVRERFPRQPVFLLGHSMGGLISVNYLLAEQQQLAGCILSGAALETEIEPGLLQMWLIRLFSLIAPRLGVLQLDASSVSRDPAEVKAYIQDPLVYSGKMSARTVAELFVAMNRARMGASNIRLPLLILHGGDDKLTHPGGSQNLFNAVSSVDKVLEIYPGLFHEIFNEPEREHVFADIAQWLRTRIG